MGWVCILQKDFDEEVKEFSKELDALVFACKAANIDFQDVVSDTEADAKRTLETRLINAEGPDSDVPIIMDALLYRHVRKFETSPRRRSYEDAA